MIHFRPFSWQLLVSILCPVIFCLMRSSWPRSWKRLAATKWSLQSARAHRCLERCGHSTHDAEPSSAQRQKTRHASRVAEANAAQRQKPQHSSPVAEASAMSRRCCATLRLTVELLASKRLRYAVVLFQPSFLPADSTSILVITDMITTRVVWARFPAPVHLLFDVVCAYAFKLEGPRRLLDWCLVSSR